MAGIVGRTFNPNPKPATRANQDRDVLAALVRLYEKGCNRRVAQPVGPGDIGEALNWPGFYFDGSSRLQPHLKRLLAAGLVEKVPVGPAHRGNRYVPTGPGISTDSCYRFIAAEFATVEQMKAAAKAGQLYAATMPGPCGDLGGPEEE